MKIVIVYQYYQGHNEPGHSLVYEVSQYLAERGHDVVIIAGSTGYMKRAGRDSAQRGNVLFRRERDKGVTVWRTYAYAELHRSYWGRLLSFLSFTLSSAVALLLMKRPDTVLGSSPPLFPVFSTWLVARIRRIPYVTEVRDLWPASAVELGVLRNPMLIRTMSWMERQLYNHSQRIVVLTQGIRDDIVGRGWPFERVKVVTAGIDETMLFPDPAAGRALREALGLVGKQVVLYFGALGTANNIDVLLRCARRLQTRQELVFVLVGDGMMREEIQRTIATEGLRNVLVLPAVPKVDARKYICAADLCVVTLQDIPLFRGAIPTKLLDYMACGRPVLCGVRGEALRILEEAGAGKGFEPNDDAQLAQLIEALAPDEAAKIELGARGVPYIRAHFSAARAREQVESILINATEVDGASH